MSSGRRTLKLAVLVAAAFLVAGCRLDVVAEVALHRDGSGTAAIAVTFDAELLTELDALEVDPTAELMAVVPDVPGWEVDRVAAEDGSLTVTLTHDAAGSRQLADAFRDLVAGLRDEDPALVVDLELEVDVDGTARLDGAAGLRPPATAGALIDGSPVGPAEDELAELVRRSVHPQLVVTLPGPIAAHDADALDDSTLTWDLPVGELRSVGASSHAAPQLPLASMAATLALLVLVALLGVWRWRRRRR